MRRLIRRLRSVRLIWPEIAAALLILAALGGWTVWLLEGLP